MQMRPVIDQLCCFVVFILSTPFNMMPNHWPAPGQLCDRLYSLILLVIAIGTALG